MYSMMRVEVNMKKAFRGYIEHYADAVETTMPQAYKDLLVIGLLCCGVDFDRLPIDEERVEQLVDDSIDTDDLLDKDNE